MHNSKDVILSKILKIILVAAFNLYIMTGDSCTYAYVCVGSPLPPPEPSLTHATRHHHLLLHLRTIHSLFKRCKSNVMEYNH